MRFGRSVAPYAAVESYAVSILIVPIQWAASGSVAASGTGGVTQAGIDAVMQQVAQAMRLSSQRTCKAAITVAPWQTIATPTTLTDTDSVYLAAKSVAASAGYTPSSYTRFWMLSQNLPPGYGGLTNASPGTYSWYATSSVATPDIGTFIHEFGHSIGFDHCHAAFVTDGAVSPTQTAAGNPPNGNQLVYAAAGAGSLGSSMLSVGEYGDCFSLMGGGSRVPSAPQAEQIGWLPPTRRTVISTLPTTVTLAAYDGPGPNLPLAVVYHASPTRDYWVDYRVATHGGLEVGGTPQPPGVHLLIRDFGTYPDGRPMLITAHPAANGATASASWQTSAMLTVNGSAVTTPDGFTVTADSLGTGSAQVTLS